MVCGLWFMVLTEGMFITDTTDRTNRTRNHKP